MNRFYKKVDKNGPSGCHLWTGYTTTDGYGEFHFHGATHKAHRFVYELETGPISPGMDIDHKCNVRNCVNPAHLEAVSHAENMRRLSVRKQTPIACIHGHFLSPENIKKTKSGTQCRACFNINRRAWRASVRASGGNPA